MMCPNCGAHAEFTEHSASHVETHGLDCGPYETWTDVWLTCNTCGDRTDQREIDQTDPERILDRLAAELGCRRQQVFDRVVAMLKERAHAR